ncbi:hypothetical protein BpHYR1_007094 [Brachionus plicatilis]|uniref:Uncharacterized protein n=1 Tax=Brachionus plicatilis TaxID=10195 RepID=A0A3M7SXK4_BRAPC|nr:hypothetical protein BpHYR1_007094 [Brachionus plicatilis]
MQSFCRASHNIQHKKRKDNIDFFSENQLCLKNFFHYSVSDTRRLILELKLKIWFVGCINGTDHLKNMLFFYGLQVTILAMLFYWDPAKISDFNSPHIDYVFFGCFALCENLWLTFNLKNLLKKSTDLEKSPVVVLIYGMTVYNFGSFSGYAISFLFCFPIKLYLNIGLEKGNKKIKIKLKVFNNKSIEKLNYLELKIDILKHDEKA